MSIVDHLKDTGMAMNALQIGSPEAIADCQRRLRDAQQRANLVVLYGACPRCNTPYPNETDPCIKCQADEGRDTY